MPKEQKSNYCEFCGDFHDSYREYASNVRVGEAIPDYEFETYYKADFTFVCPTELEEMAGLYPKIQEIGADVVSFSTDNVFTHKAWHDTSEAIKKINFPMGADPSGKITDAFGVLIKGGDLLHMPDEGLALRGTFIIDPAGLLRAMEVNDNSIGRSAKEALRKLQAAQFVESHPGQVCPASWNPGDDTLEPGMDLVGKI